VTAPYYAADGLTLFLGDSRDVLTTLPAGAADCIVTSPPYFGLRDYDEPDQIGLEETPAEYVDALMRVFEPAWDALADDGTLWVNLGDAYAGKANAGPTRDRHRGHSHKAGITTNQRNMTAHAPYKSLLGMPWRVAFAMIDAGWTLRNEVIWHKTNGMPESVGDRPATRHETLFLFVKQPSYWFDLDAIRETPRKGTGRSWEDRKGNGAPPRHGLTHPERDSDYRANPAGRNPGDVWSIPTSPFPEAHFATMPPALANRCVLAGCRPGGTVLDPFSGAGTSGMAALTNGREYIGIDTSATYLDLSLRTRLAQPGLNLQGVPA
jgi:DNA modification methylase